MLNHSLWVLFYGSQFDIIIMCSLPCVWSKLRLLSWSSCLCRSFLSWGILWQIFIRRSKLSMLENELCCIAIWRVLLAYGGFLTQNTHLFFSTMARFGRFSKDVDCFMGKWLIIVLVIGHVGGKEQVRGNIKYNEIKGDQVFSIWQRKKEPRNGAMLFMSRFLDLGFW